METEGQYIPKSYQFERDMNTTDYGGNRADTLVFSDESNMHYIYESMDELLDNKQDLIDMIQHFFAHQRERLEILDGYSKGHNYTINAGRRRTGEGKADYRIAHNWGGYISNFLTGYVGSIPVDVIIDDEQAGDSIDKTNQYNDIDNLNFELMYDCSRGGRSFEVHYRTQTAQGYQDAIRLVDHTEMFVIRNKTIDREIIGAVHLPIFNKKLEATVYTASEVVRFKPTETGLIKLEEDGRYKHFYKDVPVVEWWNNRFREGDWENEIGLFDAYDAAQSDTANYMSDLNDATLVVQGDFESSDLSLENIFLMAKANVFMLPTGMDAQGKQTDINAGYIYKQYDVAGTESYKNRLVSDIHRLGNVPNMDETSMGNASGEAMKYRLIALQQLRETKVNYYEKALRRRYELIANVHKELSDVTFDPSGITFTFHENLPSNVWEEIKAYTDAGGQISQETLREQASFTDPTLERDRMDKEEDERMVPFMTDAEIYGSD